MGIDKQFILIKWEKTFIFVGVIEPFKSEIKSWGNLAHKATPLQPVVF